MVAGFGLPCILSETDRMCVVISGDQDISFDEAVRVLQQELHYPEDKALQFVRRFDRNNDGHLSSLEFNAMRRKITET